ncbi:hypothetical protein [Stratiformator vulcanicus]|uniref:Uncharacterized protein n=1 Tax=Stratiformator vulcanicus TaxID=2527980 RepID=A0A517QWK5_9PLAN|nr:hypothetical protein [Stratiformator vulcanicus]QDT35948.1 hypothetical protein Pan189_03020 [Stratiformator vulcanicus]
MSAVIVNETNTAAQSQQPSVCDEANRLNEWDSRCARRVVAAYLTSCGMREPDEIATVTKRIVDQCCEKTADGEMLEGYALVHQCVEQAIDEFDEVTRRFYRRRTGLQSEPMTVPTDVAMILRKVFDEFPGAWEGSPQATHAADRILQTIARDIVPVEVPTKMHPQPIDRPPVLLRKAYWRLARSAWTPRLRSIKRAFGI